MGIIIRKDTQIFVLEVGRYSSEERGFMLKPIDDWLDFNDGRVIAWRPLIGSIPNEPIDRFIEKHQTVSEDMFVVNWLKSMYKVPYTQRQMKEKYYCSEMAAHFLQEVGVLTPICAPAGYKPWELIHGQLPINQRFGYQPPMLIRD